jgi:hypothetical protein
MFLFFVFLQRKGSQMPGGGGDIRKSLLGFAILPPKKCFTGN